MRGMNGPAGRLARWLDQFSALFTRPTWQRVLVLMMGAILTPHRRTVSSALRATGHSLASDFAWYHNVLNRSRWSALAGGRLLLRLLIAAFVPSGPIVVGIDDTIERRWGAKIKARNLSGSGPLEPRPFCEGQRIAMVIDDAACSNPLGSQGLGVAIPDGSGPFRTLGGRPRGPS